MQSTYRVVGALFLLAACSGEGGEEVGPRDDAGELPETDGGTSDAAIACDPTDETGLEVAFDLSALTPAPAGAMVHEPAVVVLDAEGTEVGRGSDTLLLADLPVGRYTLVFERAEFAPSDSMTGQAFGVLDGTVRQVDVAECERTRVSATFSLLPSSGRLWVSSGESLGAFTEAQLAATGDVSADKLVNTPLVNDFRGFAFDRLGDLWAATSPTYGSRLLWFSPEQLGSSGEMLPRGELHAEVFANFAPVSDLVFASDGSLWVAMRSQDSSFTGFAVWTRAQLIDVMVQGGVVELEPARMLPLEGYGERVDLELSPSGALWVAAYAQDTLLRIDDLLTWTGPAPDASFTVVSDPGAVAQRGPENIAFAGNGDAVAIFWTTGAVMTITAAQLAGPGGELALATNDFFVDQLPQGLVIDGTDRVLLGNYGGEGIGNILGWTAGTMPEALISTTDVTDPTDLLLDPRPR
jgi:hypothetical protein